MNDLQAESKFSFGKVELGVIPDESEYKPILQPSHENPVHTALCNKMDAVDALDSIKHSLVSNLSKVQYIVIRNSLEEMADLLRRYEGKPLPQAKPRNLNRKISRKRKGGKHDKNHL